MRLLGVAIASGLVVGVILALVAIPLWIILAT